MKTAVAAPAVPRDEINRRIADFRREAYQRRLPAIIVYSPEQHACPWDGCERFISGIDFQLDRMGGADKIAKWLTAWWLGNGLVARCPGCKRHVLFGYEIKRAVADVATCDDALLPEAWSEIAIVAPKS